MPMSGPAVADLQRRAYALVGERRRHAHVEHHQVGLVVGQSGHEGVGVAEAGDHVLPRIDQ